VVAYALFDLRATRDSDAPEPAGTP
jgi:hypothetical protein